MKKPLYLHSCLNMSDFCYRKNICVSQTHFQILRIFAPGRYSYQKPIEIMNKKLFEKIKSLCKDTGLSEKYLKAITEKLGGSIEDDSTDEAAIEEVANLVADVAKESQGEATRWANKNKGKNKPKKDDDPDDGSDDDPPIKGKGKRKEKKDSDPMEERLKALEEQLAEYKSNEEKGKRSKAIQEAFEKHNIPKHLRDRLAKSFSDDEDLDEAVSTLKQDLITSGLVSEDSGGAKAASAKQVDEAANDLLDSITVK